MEETVVTEDSPYKAASPSGKYAWFVPKHIQFPSSIYAGLLYESLRVAKLDTAFIFHLKRHKLPWLLYQVFYDDIQLTVKSLEGQLNSIVKIAPTIPRHIVIRCGQLSPNTFDLQGTTSFGVPYRTMPQFNRHHS